MTSSTIASAAPARPAASDKPSAVEPSRGGLSIAGHRFRRRWLALVVALVAIAAILVAEVPQFFASSPQSTIWQEITAGITDTIVPKDTALEAFAYVYKVDIPGVVVPSGVDAADAPTSGTGAMRWVQADWNQLSSAQQAVIDRYLPPQTTQGTQQMAPAPSAAGFAPRVASANRGAAFDVLPAPQQRGSTSAAPISWPFVTSVPADASPDLALAMANDMASIIAQMGPKLGLPAIVAGPAQTPDITLTLSDANGGDALLDTRPLGWSDGHFSPCNVTAYKNAWGNSAWTAGNKVSPTMHVLLAHEVVHCYQNVAVGDVYIAAAMPSWMIEGSADYLAVDFTGTIGPGDSGAWKDYLKAETSLTNRTYDGMGYFALLAHEGRNLWATIAGAWKAAATSTQRSSAFIGILHGEDSDVRDDWAETYVNDPAWQDPWVLPGLGAPTGLGAPQRQGQALAAPGWVGGLWSRSNTVLNVNGTAGEVVTVLTDGLASVRDTNGHASMDFREQSFCTVESCVCPEGTVLAGQDVAPAHLTIPFLAAINAPVEGANWTVVGTKLQDICRGAPTPQPQATAAPHGPCGTTCTQSNGDPHLTTVNRYRYDFQAAGEFTLLRTPDGSVDIQARQEPYGLKMVGGVATGGVSINTAVAAKVGSHRVGVYVTSAGLVARVDGQPADLSGGPMDLGNGGSISAVDQGFEIDMPDGTTLWALSVGVWGINAQIHPSPALLTSGQGLLGPIIPGGIGLPALPDGTRLPRVATDAERKAVLYGKFADAWQITDATSLFDYDAGKNTASYIIKPYPNLAGRSTLSDLSASEQAAGQAACSGITDPALAQECVFDVGVTGDSGFAGTYTATQTLYDSGVTEAAPSPTARATGPAPTPATASGKFFTVTPIADSRGFAQGPDDTVYFSVRTPDNAAKLIAFDPVAGRILNQVSVPDVADVHYAAGSVWLAGLVTDSNGHNCNVTRFEATTLAQQAMIPIPCTFTGGPGAVASDGGSLWITDTSKWDLGTGKGAVMTRIDPATNTLGTAPTDSVALPFVNGYAMDSQGAFFYDDSDKGWYVLPQGAASFTSLGKFAGPPPRPFGAGLWHQSNTAKAAEYYTAAGTPSASVPVGGSLVAGDANAAYVEVLGNNPATGETEEELWRYPLDGSTPTEIATAPEMGSGNFLSYYGDPMPQANGHGVLKVWATRDTSGQRVLLLQWTPVP